MTPEARRCAESAHRAASDDLRFADAKALFVALVVGSWTNAVNAAVSLSAPANPAAVKVLSILFVGLVLATMAVALSAICPKWPDPPGGKLHEVRRVSRLRGMRVRRGDVRTVTYLARQFETAEGAPGSIYDASLLLDHTRIGARCKDKYRQVVAAVWLAYFAFPAGVAVIVVKMWDAAPAGAVASATTVTRTSTTTEVTHVPPGGLGAPAN
jgi:hypothetical protein